MRDVSYFSTLKEGHCCNIVTLKIAFVEVVVILEIFKHVESKSGQYFGLSLFLKEV